MTESNKDSAKHSRIWIDKVEVTSDELKMSVEQYGLRDG
jgi:hypothetical protein